jgi:hypothetical protein
MEDYPPQEVESTIKELHQEAIVEHKNIVTE